MCFGDKSAFESGLLLLRHRNIFSLFVLPCFSFSLAFCEALLPKGAYRPWDHFSFSVKSRLLHVNYQSDLGFQRFLSFLLSLYTLFPNQVYLEGFLFNILKTRQCHAPSPLTPVSVHWFSQPPKTKFPRRRIDAST